MKRQKGSVEGRKTLTNQSQGHFVTPEAPDGCETGPENGCESVSISKSDPGGAIVGWAGQDGEMRELYRSGVVSPEVLTQNLTGGLQATRPVKLRDADGNERIEHVPDWDQRRRWQEHLVVTAEGKPISRQMSVKRTQVTTENMEELAARSPALVATMERILARVKAGATPVDVEEVPEKASQKKGASKRGRGKPMDTEPAK